MTNTLNKPFAIGPDGRVTCPKCSNHTVYWAQEQTAYYVIDDSRKYDPGDTVYLVEDDAASHQDGDGKFACGLCDHTHKDLVGPDGKAVFCEWA